MIYHKQVMRILITGIAGFVGSNLAEYVHDQNANDEIIGIDNFVTGFPENVPDFIEFHKIDLLDHEALDKVFANNNIDIIVHAAAFAAEALSPYVRRYTYLNNVVASTNLINAAINHDVKKFVFFSSIASYGDLSPPFKEDMIPKHKDIYGLSKYTTTEDLKIASEQHGLDFVVFCPFNIYGEKQSLNSRYRNVIGIWLQSLISGDETLNIYGDGEQRRSFTYIGDILPAIYKAVTDESIRNEKFNLGAEKFYSVNELADTIMTVTGKGTKVYHEGRHEVKNAWCDVTKAKERLGFEDKTNLEDGIRKMYAWAKTSPKRPVERFEGIEIKKGLYSFWKN